MKDSLVTEVLHGMMQHLSDEQLYHLKQVTEMVFINYEITKKKYEIMSVDDSWNHDLEAFLITKMVEGKSADTIIQYRGHLVKLLSYINKNVREITTDGVFEYIKEYKKHRNVSNLYLNNMRLVFSSFFTWLCNKGFILKNPISGLDRIKVPKIIKKPFTDEEREILHCHATNKRDLAIMEFLYSTGVRVSELVKVNISDIRLSDKELIVYGKGDKERIVYITPKSSVHLRAYMNSRTDSNEALFVSNKKPFNRLSKAGIENALKVIGKNAGISKVHPHRFRRTMATNAMSHGMPVQEVKELLGHAKIETTMLYCTVNQENVKHSHTKYVA